MFVGIDAGKFEFDVYQQGLAQPFILLNTSAAHDELVRWLGKPEGQFIALEPTGTCERALREALTIAGFTCARCQLLMSETLRDR